MSLFVDLFEPIQCLEVKLPSGRITRLPIPRSPQVIDFVNINGMVQPVDADAWRVICDSAPFLLQELQKDLELRRKQKNDN